MGAYFLSHKNFKYKKLQFTFLSAKFRFKNVKRKQRLSKLMEKRKSGVNPINQHQNTVRFQKKSLFCKLEDFLIGKILRFITKTLT